jgi:hypothetical protein
MAMQPVGALKRQREQQQQAQPQKRQRAMAAAAKPVPPNNDGNHHHRGPGIWFNKTTGRWEQNNLPPQCPDQQHEWIEYNGSRIWTFCTRCSYFKRKCANCDNEVVHLGHKKSLREDDDDDESTESGEEERFCYTAPSTRRSHCSLKCRDALRAKRNANDDPVVIV